ncbi:MAG: SEC-C metal-binding domain-containing protein [Exilibacterium sp.]
MKTHCIGRNDPCPCGSGKKFKHCCLSKENSTASGQGAAGISETLHKALESRQFNSLEEAQAFLDQITQQQNRRQLDEFHGLSPEQMHQMLNFPFASPGLGDWFTFRRYWMPPQQRRY